MDLTPLISTLGIIAVAELGDKTQLATIALSTRYRAISVFVGALLAVAMIDGLSILAGIALGSLIPMQGIKIAGAAIFIGFGIYTLFSRKAEKIKVKRGNFAILTSFSLISVMELGDKTQFAILALAARYSAPALVFLGAILAFTLMMGIGVVVGSRLPRLVPIRYLRIFTGGLFILFGVIFLLSILWADIL